MNRRSFYGWMAILTVLMIMGTAPAREAAAGPVQLRYANFPPASTFGTGSVQDVDL